MGPWGISTGLNNHLAKHAKKEEMPFIIAFYKCNLSNFSHVVEIALKYWVEYSLRLCLAPFIMAVYWHS